MTRDECKQIIMIIDAAYPNFKVNDLTGTINVWHALLEDYDYKSIQMGLKVYIATSGSAFGPSVSELIAASRKPLELAETDAVTAWQEVRKAIRDSYYHAEDHFEKFPEAVKKVVGSPSQLRSWGQMESEKVDTVIWNNFKKSYETTQSRNREINSLPVGIRGLIQQTSTQMIGGA